MNLTHEKYDRDRTVARLAVPLAIGVFVVGAAGTLFRPAFAVSGVTTTPVVEKHAVATVEPARQVAAPETTLSMGRSVDAPRPPTAQDIEQTFERGQGLVASGDFAAARLLFARAAEAGHAGAMFALASTYDPNVLAARGARGLVGEPAEARAFYAKALEAGFAGAKERMDALGS